MFNNMTCYNKIKFIVLATECAVPNSFTTLDVVSSGKHLLATKFVAFEYRYLHTEPHSKSVHFCCSLKLPNWAIPFSSKYVTFIISIPGVGFETRTVLNQSKNSRNTFISSLYFEAMLSSKQSKHFPSCLRKMISRSSLSS